MDLSIIIVNYNTAEILRECLAHLARSADSLQKEIIIVDNASSDGSVDLVRREFPAVRLVANASNVGFAQGNLDGLKISRGRYVLLLNSDAFVFHETIQRTFEYMEGSPSVGILGCRLVGRDGEPQFSSRAFPTPWRILMDQTGLGQRRGAWPAFEGIDPGRLNSDGPCETDWVPGCYYLVRRKMIDVVGFLDPRYFLYYEEVDLCLTARRAGWKVVYYPLTAVVHLGGASAARAGKITSSGRQLDALRLESEYLYFRKNYGFISVVSDLAFTIGWLCLRAVKKFLWLDLSSGRELFARSGLAWDVFRATSCGIRPLTGDERIALKGKYS